MKVVVTIEDLRNGVDVSLDCSQNGIQDGLKESLAVGYFLSFVEILRAAARAGNRITEQGEEPRWLLE